MSFYTIREANRTFSNKAAHLMADPHKRYIYTAIKISKFPLNPIDAICKTATVRIERGKSADNTMGK